MTAQTQILLVDDDSSLRGTLRICLEMSGYQCVEAKDGDEARVWLEEEHPVHLIVTDHHMPKMSGLEFVKGVRSQSKTRALPIIFYSGQLTDKLKDQAIEAGVSAVLEKPFPFQEFLDLVGELCDKTGN